MKKRENVKMGMRIFLLAGLSLLLTVSVLGNEEKRTGSITLQFPSACREAVTMAIYQIAEYEDGEFFYRSEYAESGIVITDLNRAEQVEEAAEKFRSYVIEKNLEPLMQAEKEGDRLLFSGLECGFYLIMQTGGQEKILVQAVLTAIPGSVVSESERNYDIVLDSKFTYPGGAVILNKVDGEGEPLSDAQFILEEKHMVKNLDELPSEITIEQDEAGNSYYWKELEGKLLSNEMGQLSVSELPQGIYRFIETRAPEGYLLDCTPYIFEITAAGKVELLEDGSHQKVSGTVEQLQVINFSVTPVPTAEPIPTEEPLPTTEPVPTGEPLPTAEPIPTEEPLPTTEPVPTGEPLPTAEPQPTAEPIPTEEPLPTGELLPTAEPIPTETPFPTQLPLPTDHTVPFPTGYSNENPSQEGSYSESTHTGQNRPSDNVQTGDETDILPFILLLLSAAVILLTAAAYRKRSKERV